MSIFKNTFKRGIHPPGNKFTKNMALEEFPIPETVFISMSQHIGAPAKPIVQIGDHVNVGQKVGEAGGFVSAPVFSSVSGTVKGFLKMSTATGAMADHIEIENDGL